MSTETIELVREISNLAKLNQKPKAPQNTFPYEVLGPEMARVIEETNACLDFPKQFIASSILVALSMAIGNTREIINKDDYRQTAILYLALCGFSGSMKSHPLKWALKPIQERENRAAREHAKAFEEWERIKGLSKEERTQEGIVGTPKEPRATKYILNEFTKEKLLKLLKNNPRGLAIFVDELAGFFKNMNRFNSGSDTELYLSMWGGFASNNETVGGGAIHIGRPFVSIVGTIQPAILPIIFADGKGENGFTQRFLFVVPDDLKRSHANNLELDPVIKATYRNIIERLMELPLEYDQYTDDPAPLPLTLSTEAREIWNNWYNPNVDAMNNAEDDYISGLCSKMENYCLRFALILQMLYYVTDPAASGTLISPVAMEGAIKLAEYFRSNALKVYNRVSGNDPMSQLDKKQKELYNSLPTEFTTREAIKLGKKVKVSERNVYRWLSQDPKENDSFIKIGIVAKAERGQFLKLSA